MSEETKAIWSLAVSIYVITAVVTSILAGTPKGLDIGIKDNALTIEERITYGILWPLIAVARFLRGAFDGLAGVLYLEGNRFVSEKSSKSEVEPE